MGRKKYTTEFRQQVVHHYLNSDGGAKKKARLFGVSPCAWVGYDDVN
jgi:transposase